MHSMTGGTRRNRAQQLLYRINSTYGADSHSYTWAATLQTLVDILDVCDGRNGCCSLDVSTKKVSAHVAFKWADVRVLQKNFGITHLDESLVACVECVARYCSGVFSPLCLFAIPIKKVSIFPTEKHSHRRGSVSRRADSTQKVRYTPPRPGFPTPTLSVDADWVTTIADRMPRSSFAEDGTVYNSNLPSLTEGWW